MPSISALSTIPDANEGALLRVCGLSKAFGGVSALDHIDLLVRPAEIRAIIGPNGAGKSTLLNLISGLYRPDAGTISFGGHPGASPRAKDLARLGIQRTFQNLALFEGLTVRENVALGRTASRHATALERVVGIGRIRRERDETNERVEATAAFLRLSGDLDRTIGELPYGTRKKVEFARALVAAPRVMLLDEPMAGLGPEDKAQFARHIVEARDTLGTTIILIEHDVGIVMGLADRIAVLDHGRKIADGLPAAVRDDPAVIEAYLGRDHHEDAA